MINTILPKLPFMLLIVASLISGILTGWFRIGFDMPVSRIYLHHGAIMTGSFLGTVILIERIVALKRKWLFSFPLINASSLIFYWLDWTQMAFLMLIIGAVGLFYVFFLINRIHTDIPHKVMWAGAAAWFIGNIHLFIFNQYAHSILWWMAFLLLTIVGERLELCRFLPVSSTKKNLLLVLLALFVASCVIPIQVGSQLIAGIALIFISAWLMMYDMVRKSIKMTGIHRFSAITLMCGYLWLAVSGLLYLMETTGMITYDMLIHSFFLGFIFSMIFAHAPIILPGVLNLGFKPFHPSLYAWVAIFQISLIFRIFGNMLSFSNWKQFGGLVNGISILLFIVNLMIIVISRKVKTHNANSLP